MAKQISGTAVFLIVLLIIVVLFMVGKCSLSCSTKEGYTRAVLGNQCQGLQRTPVDYAFKNPHGWQRNPHYRAYPGDEHQPLDYGPIDFHQDARRLDENDGVLFQQYRSDFLGVGIQDGTIGNDSKNRFDLTNVGDYGARQQMDDMQSVRFGPGRPAVTEAVYNEPNPYFDKLIGGRAYLTRDLLSD